MCTDQNAYSTFSDVLKNFIYKCVCVRTLAVAIFDLLSSNLVYTFHFEIAWTSSLAKRIVKLEIQFNWQFFMTLQFLNNRIFNMSFFSKENERMLR